MITRTWNGEEWLQIIDYKLETIDKDVEGPYYAYDNGLLFTVNNDIFIESVEVDPDFTGELTIYLKESTPNENVTDKPRIRERTVHVVANTTQRVYLNWNVPPGQYAMFRADGSEKLLRRTAEGQAYPYVSTDGSVEITEGTRESGHENTRFYHFFNWHLYSKK